MRVLREDRAGPKVLGFDTGFLHPGCLERAVQSFMIRCAESYLGPADSACFVRSKGNAYADRYVY